MIKDNQKRLNRMHVLLDILVTVVAYALAWFIVISGKVLPLDEGVLKPQVYFMALIFIVPIYLILYASFHLYVPKRIQGRRSELANICKANVIGLMLFTFVLFGLRRFVSHLSYFSTKMILAFFAANIILLEAERISIRIFLRPCGPTAIIRSMCSLLATAGRPKGSLTGSASIRNGVTMSRESWMTTGRPALHIKRYRCWDPPIIWRISWRPIRWTK